MQWDELTSLFPGGWVDVPSGCRSMETNQENVFCGFWFICIFIMICSHFVEFIIKTHEKKKVIF